VGGIVGNAMKETQILNCWSSGLVEASSAYANVGAVLGRDQGCSVTHCHAPADVCNQEADDASKVTQITKEQMCSEDFLNLMNDWVREFQRPATGYALWQTDADGYPVPAGEVPDYIPVVGNLTLTQPENGTAVLSANSAWTESEITVTVTADEGFIPYQVWFCGQDAPDTPVYAEKSGENTFAFSMPYGDAQVYVSVLALPDNPVWDGSVADSFAGGDGTENNPYLIGNASQLALMEAYKNKTVSYRLIADIYLNDTSDWENWTAENGPANVWTPISQLRATFDGDDHTIYGLYTDAAAAEQGLFRQTYQDTCLKNLHIKQSQVFGTERVGALSARIQGAVVNCSSNGKVQASGKYVGGLVGASDTSFSSIVNCVNYGSVETAAYAVGGIAGSINSTMQGCVNYGSVTSTMTSYPVDPGREMRVGGLVGEASDAAVMDCENHGDVTGYLNCGGIVGRLSGSVERCVNYGDVNALVSSDNEQSGKGCAGIVASLGRGAHVLNCTNYGNVNGRERVGGIAGLIGYSDAAAEDFIRGCVNSGTITGGKNVAGIVAIVNG